MSRTCTNPYALFVTVFLRRNKVGLVFAVHLSKIKKQHNLNICKKLKWYTLKVKEIRTYVFAIRVLMKQILIIKFYTKFAVSSNQSNGENDLLHTKLKVWKLKFCVIQKNSIHYNFVKNTCLKIHVEGTVNEGSEKNLTIFSSLCSDIHWRSTIL